MAIDTPGHLLAIQVTTATAQERAKVHLFLAQEVQYVSSESVTLAFVDQGYTGQEPAQAAWQEGKGCNLHHQAPGSQKRLCFASWPLAWSSSGVLAGSSACDD